MNTLKLQKSFFLICLLILIVCIAHPVIKSKIFVTPKVSNGFLDLTNWNLNDTRTFKLNGTWEFYFNQLISPNEFKNNKLQKTFTYQKIPSRWDNYIINGKSLPYKGYATYRMRLKLPDGYKHYGIKITGIFSSSRIYINGEKVLTCGSPGTSEKTTKHEFYADTAYFTLDKSDVEIIVQVSNFVYAYNGIFYPIYFGTEKGIGSLRFFNILMDNFYFISMTLMSIYTFVISFQRREKKVLLYLSAYSLASAFYRITYSEALLSYVFPNLSFVFTMQFQAISIVLEYYFLFLFTYYAFKATRFHTLKKVVKIIAAFFLILTLITKFYLWEFTFAIFFSTTLALVIVITYIIQNQYHISMEGKYYLYAAMLCSITMFVINFCIIVLGFESNYFPPIVQPLFILSLSFYMSEKYSNTFLKVETLSERLTQLDKLKDDFLAKTSHELKTPLNGIINISQSLLDGADGKLNEEQYEDILFITNIGKRLSTLVYDILDYSKLKNMDITLQTNIIDIYPIIDSTLEIYRYLIKGKLITFENRVPSNTFYIKADENRFKQIIFNLFDNAVKYTKKGTVLISAYQENAEVAIAIKDTGIGIPAFKLDSIFHSYEQLELDGNASSGGVGLGLSITKQLMDLHKGKITVESEIGIGSCFTVTFPAGNKNLIQRNIETTIPPLETKIKTPTQYHLPYSKHVNGEFNILVVDDEYSNLKSLLNMLSILHYNVTITDNPETALSLIYDNTSYDLIILDIMMPIMSGYEVCRKIRERYSILDLPILILTAKTSPLDTQTGFTAGANDFLLKPYEWNQLECRIRTLIQLKKSKELLLERETAFLQAQIKPHFLFNALNTISSFCYSDSEKASELLSELSVFLRGSFDFKSTESFITLEKELRLVKAYVAIEKARYDSRLEVKYEYDSSILKYSILPLTIQPIVENSIRHGIMKKIGGGQICIQIKVMNDNIVVHVNDTGVGMEEAMIGTLLKEKPIGNGVGLSNINSRLKNYFNTCLQIESKKNEGTYVSFQIPLLMKSYPSKR